MQGLITELPKFGLLGILMAVIISIMMYFMRKDSKASDERNRAITFTLKEIANAMILHNERASENHKALMAHSATVMHNHEKIIDGQMKLIMSINTQDAAMAGFQRDIGDIKCALNSIDKLIAKK